MRILIHGINFRPELVGIGKYTGELADWLAQRGHEVRVVTVPPFNPEGRVHSDYSSWRYRRESSRKGETGDVTVYRCPLWVSRNPSAVRRILHLASFALSGLPVMLAQIFWRPSLVFVVEPTLLCVPAALMTAKLSGGCSWLHIQDFEVDAGFAVGMLRSSAMRSVIGWVEKRLLSACDRVSTISAKMVARLSEEDVPSSRSVLFPNWVDTEKVFPMGESSPLRAELAISHETVVALYSGSMGRKQGLEILVQAAERLAENRTIQFVFCGDGSYRETLAERSVGLPNVRWIPLQPAERLNDLLNLADIHLLPQGSEVADLVMPSKLTGMLASGRPVIATAAEDTQLGLAIKDRGIRVDTFDVQGFVASIVRLASDPELRNRLGQNGRRFAETTLDKHRILEMIEQEFFRIVGSSLTAMPAAEVSKSEILGKDSLRQDHA